MGSQLGAGTAEPPFTVQQTELYLQPEANIGMFPTHTSSPHISFYTWTIALSVCAASLNEKISQGCVLEAVSTHQSHWCACSWTSTHWTAALQALLGWSQLDPLASLLCVSVWCCLSFFGHLPNASAPPCFSLPLCAAQIMGTCALNLTTAGQREGSTQVVGRILLGFGHSDFFKCQLCKMRLVGVVGHTSPRDVAVCLWCNHSSAELAGQPASM